MAARDNIIHRKETISVIDPKDVDEETVNEIIEFLNKAESAEQIADFIELEENRDIGIKIAERILAKKKEVREFKSLEDVAEIPMIGPKRLADIIESFEIKKIEPERLEFKALLLKNPNYFGNVKDIAIEPVKPKQNDTRYEELTCIGYNPKFERLEAIVHIKRSYGYGSSICGNGTPEYVRFFIDWNNDGNWEDLGVVSFRAYNIPGRKPLEYDVTLKLDARKKPCNIENLPRVKAILSWNVIPPANDPNYTPVWGNSKNANIQIDKRTLIITDIISTDKLKINPKLIPIIDLNKPLETKELEYDILQLNELYKEKVSASRFLYPTIYKMIYASNIEPDLPIKDIIKPEIVDDILKLQQNIRYEELTCIGYNRDQDELVAIIKIKLPSGYSGDLCSKGSKEYVAFWVDYGSGWQYVGTTSVNVYDFATIPAEGLDYAVYLPLNSLDKRQSCEKGAKILKVRAILSWNVTPPNNPNYNPHWGNRKNTLIQLEPGISTTGHNPVIQSVGNMAVANISVNGLANGTPTGGGCEAKDSPFGGAIKITGKIANPPDTLGGGANPLQYKVYVSDDGINWEQLTNKFNLWYNDLINGSWGANTKYEQKLDSNGWYTYIEDLTGKHQRHVTENVLAIWQSNGKQGKYKIKIEVRDPNNPMIIYTSNVVDIMVNNKAPKASINITSGGGPCSDFKINDKIQGTYSAYNTEYFGQLTISVEPNLGGGKFDKPLPGSSNTTITRTYPTVSTNGENGIWELDTTGMPKCGYIIRIRVWDRTIVNNSTCNNYSDSDVVGLCLREE
ncbi:MAG: hypothetical protein KatS3mg003_0847 [Candidatus Nitrosocaldaceae archaeon]|nr:MAG: hypothetical protein KatS3mg003_0847 [Candidatus Nitrosocaldaceae archaeon]